MAKGKYEQWLTPEGLLKIEGWARNGLTNEQIASNMGITRETLNVWSKQFPLISDTLKKGKDVIDIQVENAMLKRALGYEFTETTQEAVTEVDLDGHPVTKLKVTKLVTKEVAADVTAMIFWLKNRRPEYWRDRKEVNMSGEVNNPMAGLTTEELKKLING